MKRSVLYLFFIVLLSAFQCGDDTFEPDNLVENSDLVIVQDNKTSFEVGEYIFINTSIDNEQQTIDDRVIALKDFFTGGEHSLDYSLGLFRMNELNEKVPVFIENAQASEGTIEFNDQNPYFNIISPYDANSERFSSAVGVRLDLAGDYMLAPDAARFEDDVHFIYFDLSGLGSLGTLQLNTSILNADADGIYRFTVE